MEPRTEDAIDELARRTTEGVDIGGTSRQGTVTASREELRLQFGEPDTGYPKSTYHWQVRFADGTVATIYDYYGSNRHVGKEEDVEWSVGGRSEDAVELLQFLGLDAETVEMAAA